MLQSIRERNKAMERVEKRGKIIFVLLAITLLILIFVIAFGSVAPTHFGPEDDYYHYRKIFDFEFAKIMIPIFGTLFAISVMTHIAQFTPRGKENRIFSIFTAILSAFSSFGFAVISGVFLLAGDLYLVTAIPMAVALDVIAALLIVVTVLSIGNAIILRTLHVTDQEAAYMLGAAAERLRLLKKALEEGLITEEEYEEKRKDLVDRL